jgi:2-C-methyl-D-erythritol 4-phosphate cytidylyltransferase / 2-C-methyl-D-erythritol 2,4-cyclodiphosphate synthase
MDEPTRYNRSLFVSAIIAAGGRGQRIGGAVPKVLLAVGGRSILERSVALFVAHPQIDEIVVALPAEIAADPPRYLTMASKPIRVVAGGPRRQDSVANAVQAISDCAEIIVIHDAARPFATADLIGRTIAAAAESGAAVAAVASRDTVKRSAAGRTPARAELHVVQWVAETLPRETIFLAQTPQAFRRDVLRDALALGEREVEATDEASLAERAGHSVRLVQGDGSNIKVTTPDDLAVAESFARRQAASVIAVRSGRAGTGYDLHRLVEGRPLVIGGVTVPCDRGALGHSDADVVCHAITDAMLGAAGLGDIGRHFPDTDLRWKDASSLELLAHVASLIAENGFAVGNVDVTVVLEKPRIRDYIDSMRTAVAGALGIDPDLVSVKSKTNEGVDAIGRGEAIAAHAVALLRSSSPEPGTWNPEPGTRNPEPV